MRRHFHDKRAKRLSFFFWRTTKTTPRWRRILRKLFFIAPTSAPSTQANKFWRSFSSRLRKICFSAGVEEAETKKKDKLTTGAKVKQIFRGCKKCFRFIFVISLEVDTIWWLMVLSNQHSNARANTRPATDRAMRTFIGPQARAFEILFWSTPKSLRSLTHSRVVSRWFEIIWIILQRKYSLRADQILWRRNFELVISSEHHQIFISEQ